MTVTEDSDPTPIYSGAFDGMQHADRPDETAGTAQPWAAGVTHTYVFTVTFPNGTPTTTTPSRARRRSSTSTWTATQS